MGLLRARQECLRMISVSVPVTGCLSGTREPCQLPERGEEYLLHYKGAPFEWKRESISIWEDQEKFVWREG